MHRILRVGLALLASVAAALGQTPAADQPLQRIAFGSCNKDDKPQLIWKSILESKPDLWIWLGDIVYARAGDLADLQRRYAIAKAQPDYKALRTEARVIGIWDDNDFAIGKGPNRNAQKIASQKLLLDFLDEPAESARRQQAGVYAAYDFGPPGKHVKIILLDVRYHHDEIGADYLGAEQWRWLEEQLTGSTADVNIIGSGIQVIASEHPYDKWADFRGAHQKLFDLLAKTKPRNVIFLSGDRHLGEISRLDDPRLAQPIYDITSSGMTHHAQDWWFRSNFSKEPNRYRVGQNYLALNFGLVQFDWDASPPTVTLQIRGTDNAPHVEQKVTLAPAEAANR